MLFHKGYIRCTINAIERHISSTNDISLEKWNTSIEMDNIETKKIKFLFGDNKIVYTHIFFISLDSKDEYSYNTLGDFIHSTHKHVVPLISNLSFNEKMNCFVIVCSKKNTLSKDLKKHLETNTEVVRKVICESDDPHSIDMCLLKLGVQKIFSSPLTKKSKQIKFEDVIIQKTFKKYKKDNCLINSVKKFYREKK